MPLAQLTVRSAQRFRFVPNIPLPLPSLCSALRVISRQTVRRSDTLCAPTFWLKVLLVAHFTSVGLGSEHNMGVVGCIFVGKYICVLGAFGLLWAAQFYFSLSTICRFEAVLDLFQLSARHKNNIRTTYLERFSLHLFKTFYTLFRIPL